MQGMNDQLGATLDDVVILEQTVEPWIILRRMVLVPSLQLILIVCLVMQMMVLFEKAFMALSSWYGRFLGPRPHRIYKCDPIEEDEELGSLAYPMVLVQIPMYNEKEVYQLSIGAACSLTWPADRLIVQVLDDSTDPVTKVLVEQECQKWRKKGINVKYETRKDRAGYKAGNLKEGMKHEYVQHCEYLAIFDADFQPEPDFLMKTVPFLVHNPRLGLVQARWKFVNPGESLMTTIQRMTLDYHFKIEQESGSSMFSFFGFNGTAGVWRISAMIEAGGWKDRTTVEDMDLAIRANLKGWKFVYVPDVKVKSELPGTLKTYRKQQHRWMCGAANLFRKMWKEILFNKGASFWWKFYLLYDFFFARKIVSHLVNFSLYNVVIPVAVLVPEINLPVWIVAYLPTIMTLLTATENPRLIHIIPFSVLFENVISMHRMKSTLIGLFEAARVNEWVVTEKSGGATNTKTPTPKSQILKKPSFISVDKINLSEIGFAAFLLFCATCDLLYGDDYYFVYMYLQSISFIVVGVGYVGK
ncbi:cellulose synthase like [Rhynchospora pubera]|uniref:glucomannan 4-beta-mannosyltransferase n=1 Tax=Rhynchospora pubera TaxID=906938 RepID=A0AAV8DF39_9POAL|nr:cellulose synthase like [Rhynchospora pubera]